MKPGSEDGLEAFLEGVEEQARRKKTGNEEESKQGDGHSDGGRMDESS